MPTSDTFRHQLFRLDKCDDLSPLHGKIKKTDGNVVIVKAASGEYGSAADDSEKSKNYCYQFIRIDLESC